MGSISSQLIRKDGMGSVLQNHALLIPLNLTKLLDMIHSLLDSPNIEFPMRQPWIFGTRPVASDACKAVLIHHLGNVYNLEIIPLNSYSHHFIIYHIFCTRRSWLSTCTDQVLQRRLEGGPFLVGARREPTHGRWEAHHVAVHHLDHPICWG